MVIFFKRDIFLVEACGSEVHGFQLSDAVASLSYSSLEVSGVAGHSDPFYDFSNMSQ